MICKTKNTPNSLLCWSHLPARAPPCLSGLMMVWRFFQSHDLDTCCNLHWNYPLQHVHTCSWRTPALPSHPSSSLPCSSRPSTFLVPWDTQNQLSVSELGPSLSFSHPLDCQLHGSQAHLSHAPQLAAHSSMQSVCPEGTETLGVVQ